MHVDHDEHREGDDERQFVYRAHSLSLLGERKRKKSVDQFQSVQ